MEGCIIGLRRGAWVIWASEGEGRCAQSQSYEGELSLEAFAFRLKASMTPTGDKDQIQRSSNQMFLQWGSSYITSTFGEVF